MVFSVGEDIRFGAFDGCCNRSVPFVGNQKQIFGSKGQNKLSNCTVIRLLVNWDFSHIVGNALTLHYISSDRRYINITDRNNTERLFHLLTCSYTDIYLKVQRFIVNLHYLESLVRFPNPNLKNKPDNS